MALDTGSGAYTQAKNEEGGKEEHQVVVPHLDTPSSFPFPFTPYEIQLDLMRTVFGAIEDGKIAIVSSPTGTGKSLTLLTSTLSWLSAHRKRLDQATEDDLRRRFKEDDPDGELEGASRLADKEDPDWVVEKAVKRHMTELRAASEARAQRLAVARERERKARQASYNGAFGGPGKRPRPNAVTAAEAKQKSEDEFLPEDNEEEKAVDTGGPTLSAEVRALLAQLEPTKTDEEDVADEDVPKVYFASRTHSQLRQLTSELLKTTFSGESEPADPSVETDDPVSLVPLASRRQMCINDKVRSLPENRLNDACLDMQKSGAQRCAYLPKEDGPMLDARDSVLATVRDIEDLVLDGKKRHVCPYYATRKAVKQAQLVTLPYNLLLQKNAREALGIDLTDQIVVIDEAHNLIDTILGIYSCALSAAHIRGACSQLAQYLARFKKRLKPRHALWIKQTLSVLRGLARVCETYGLEAKSNPKKAQGELLDINTFMARAAEGSGSDAVNLVEMVSYLKESKLARKVSGFAESLEEQMAKAKRSNSVRHASIAAFHSVEAFLLSMTDAKDDGRIILSYDKDVTVKYVLLNPAERFQEVVEKSRAIVLAGGTMEPLSDFYNQLFPGIPRSKFATISCSHVIPKSNLLTQVVSRGPRKTELEFKYSNRGDDSLITELGAVLQSTIGLVPDGVVVFVPSYAFLDRIKAAWGGTGGLLEKFNAKKQVFYEPQTAAEVDTVLRDYALSIESAKEKRTGALMFAVVGGKLSEGINFADRLGRCVIMVGLPFANASSPELAERMKYVERQSGRDAGRELYENLCMRAVNQSIGRAIRHANDYACILLVDKRYSSPRIRNKLPGWIGQDVKTPDDWSGAARALAAFFREKRQQQQRQ